MSLAVGVALAGAVAGLSGSRSSILYSAWNLAHALSARTMCFFSMYTNFQTHSTTIRGVTYIVASCCDREETIFERVGHLILRDFMSSKEGAVTNESLLDTGMDFEADQRYNDPVMNRFGEGVTIDNEAR